MSRTVPAALATHLAGTATTIAQCVRIKREDGAVYGFTEHDQALSVNLAGYLPGDAEGAVSYLPTDAFEMAAPRQSIGLGPDGGDALGVLDDARISEDDLKGGLYDGAEILLFVVNWASLSDGAVIRFYGEIGQVKIEDGGFTAEVRSLAARLGAVACNTIGPACKADLGDAACGVPMTAATWVTATAYTAQTPGDAKTGDIVAPSVANGFWYVCTVAGTSDASEPTWPTTEGATAPDNDITWTAVRARTGSGAVAAATDRRTFTATGVSFAADHWNVGVLTWTAGLNAGRKSLVKTDDGAGALTLFEPTPFDIAVSDTFDVKAGCARRWDEDCIARFGNWFNYRLGFPHVPTEGAGTP